MTGHRRREHRQLVRGSDRRLRERGIGRRVADATEPGIDLGRQQRPRRGACGGLGEIAGAQRAVEVGVEIGGIVEAHLVEHPAIADRSEVLELGIENRPGLAGPVKLEAAEVGKGDPDLAPAAFDEIRRRRRAAACRAPRSSDGGQQLLESLVIAHGVVTDQPIGGHLDDSDDDPGRVARGAEQLGEEQGLVGVVARSRSQHGCRRLERPDVVLGADLVEDEVVDGDRIVAELRRLGDDRV